MRSAAQRRRAARPRSAAGAAAFAQALAPSGAFAHDAFMGTHHVLGGALGGGLAHPPAMAEGARGVAGLDDVPFGLLMNSVLAEWGVPFASAPSPSPVPLPPAMPAAAVLPPPPAPPAQRAAAPAPGLRCLDTTHGRSCAECTAAPLEGEDALYELVGDQGKKNGEKKLRALLARCPEWSQDSARLALAESLAGRPEYARLTSCLRGADTMATLRKVDLIALARAWGYRSSQWRRRRACSRATHRALADLGGSEAAPGGAAVAALKGGGAAVGGRAAAAPPAAAWGAARTAGAAAALAATRAALEPFDNTALSGADVARYGEQRLKRLADDAVRLLAGEEAFAAAVAHGWAHVTPALCEEIRTAIAHLDVLLAKWADTLKAVFALRDVMQPAADAVAWRALAGREGALPIHEMMRQMQAFTDRGVALIDATRKQRGGAPAPPAVEVWLDELHRARMLAVELIARSQALLVNAKFAHVEMFLAVCVLVHGACTHLFTQGRAALQQRLRWMRSLLAVADDGGSDDARAAAAAAATLYASPFSV